VLESQGILGIRTFVGDPADLGEELLAHDVLQKGRGKLRTTPDHGKRLKSAPLNNLKAGGAREAACSLVPRTRGDCVHCDPTGSPFPALHPSGCSSKAPPRPRNASDLRNRLGNR
jgi:hypothetical protein